MRRISVFISIMIVLVILATEQLGIELSPSKIAAANFYAAKGEAILEGLICEVSYVDEETFKLVIEAEGAGRVLVKVSGDCAGSDIYGFPGRRASIKAQVSRPAAASNPGGFDYAAYLRTEGIYLTGKCEAVDLSVGEIDDNFFKGAVINRVSLIKNEFYEKMSKAAGETAAALYCGMLFGDKDRLSDDIYDSFRNNGTAHILSVSGLHVGVLYGFIKLIMGKRRRSLPALFITAVALLACIFLASFSVSVLRAVFMIGLHILAERTHNRYDVLSAACITASVFLIISPQTLHSVGFILSFSAVISLDVIGKGLQRMIKKRSVLTGIFIPIFAIQLGTAPINAHIFNYFSVASFLSNIPVIFLSSIMIPLGMVVLILENLWKFLMPIADMLIEICSFIGEMMIFFNDLTGAYGRLCLKSVSPSITLTIFFYFFILVVFSEFTYLHKPGLKAGAAIAMATILILPLSYIEEENKPEVVFLDIGQGDCAHIRTPSGKNFLVDGGGSIFSDYDTGQKTIEPYLLKNGIDRIDGVFISHMDADHYKGTASLNEIMETGSVYLYEGYRFCEAEAADTLNKEAAELKYLSKGDVIKLDERVTIEVIFPRSGKKLSLGENEDESNFEGDDLNENSLVFRLNYMGTRILFTGDIGEAESELPRDFSCDIVKVPHHGSKYSSSEAFVEGLGARAAVIQVGKNNFGHPAESVIERYAKNGIMVLRNDEDGAIEVRIDEDGFDIEGYKSGEKYEF